MNLALFDLDTSDINLFFWREGNEAMRQKDYVKAIEYFEQAKKRMPEFSHLIDKNIKYSKKNSRILKGYMGKDLLYINKEILDKEFAKFNTVGITEEPSEQKIIVSLTSFPQRMYDIHYALYSLLKQSYKPHMVILWLGKEKFPNREQDLPEKIIQLKQYGLTIRWVDDLRSHTKLMYALQEFPNDVIVTADDDIFYNTRWLEKLVSAYNRNNKFIHAHRVHRIVIEEDKILPYKKWKQSTWKNGNIKNVPPSFLNFFTGVGGVLYPPYSLDDEVLNIERAFKLCPSADDIWFWTMAVKKGTKINVVDEPLQIVYTNIKRELALTEEVTLAKKNVVESSNDEQIKKVLSCYDLASKLVYSYEKTINLSFICDDNYVMPTIVAITSAILNKNTTTYLNINVICNNVSFDNLKLFSKIKDKKTIIRIIHYSVNLDKFIILKNGFYVSPSALLKFELPNILSSYDKMLYIDSDVIIKKDLCELYNTNINGKYAAVVKNAEPVLLYKPPIQKKLNINHKYYFNTGMMLLNLNKMREDMISNKLIKYRKSGINYFMDQDAFNVVFEENVKYLDIFNNLLSFTLHRFSIDTIKEYFDLDINTTNNDLIKNAVIFHYASKEKPWNSHKAVYREEWHRYYNKSILVKKFDSKNYWENRYAKGGNSGAGSYNNLAQFKAEIINNFYQENKLESVIEFGVGDGNNLALYDFKNYIGFDVSSTILKLTKEKFKKDISKQFFNISEFSKQKADLSISFDVIYHLIEDNIFNEYMTNLFISAKKFVVIYSSNKNELHCEHVKHRKFTDWIEKYQPDWKLLKYIPNKYQFNIEDQKNTSFSDFYIYENSNLFQ